MIICTCSSKKMFVQGNTEELLLYHELDLYVASHLYSASMMPSSLISRQVERKVTFDPGINEVSF